MISYLDYIIISIYKSKKRKENSKGSGDEKGIQKYKIFDKVLSSPNIHDFINASFSRCGFKRKVPFLSNMGLRTRTFLGAELGGVASWGMDLSLSLL